MITAVYANIFTGGQARPNNYDPRFFTVLFTSSRHFGALAVYSASEYPLYQHLGPAAFLRRNIFFERHSFGYTKTLIGGTIARFFGEVYDASVIVYATVV